jgi:preprotein translocase subunit YajC
MSSGFFVLILLLLFLLWLMLVRPQRRRQQAQQAMLDHLRVGDEVLTAGGFFATVRRIDEDEVTVELGPGTEARLSKRAIAAVIPDDDDDITPSELDEEAADTGVQAGSGSDSHEPEPSEQARR